MPAFACRTRDASGEVVEKTVDAGSQREVMQLLEKSGLSPIKITEVSGSGPSALTVASTGMSTSEARARRSTGRKVKRREIMQFSIQLASSMGAGVPILTGVRSARAQTKSDALQEVLDQIIADLEGGKSLSEALRRHPRAFPGMYAGTVEAGEKSGTLEDMLNNLAEYLETDMEVRSDVRSALLYPVIVISILSIAITVLIVFIVPRFATFYSGFDAELPLATRILINGSTILAQNIVWVLAGLGGLAYCAGRLIRVPSVREAIDRILLRIPLVGKLLDTATTLHVVQMLGLFTRAGMPLLEGLRTIAKTTTNTKYRKDLQTVATGIAGGQSLTEGMNEVACFPTGARHMLASGEATGTLERACFAVARHYKKELRYLTKNVATFIEPLLTLVLAVVVLFVALAAFLPMWDLVKVMGK